MSQNSQTFLRHHIQQLQTFKNSPVFWPALYKVELYAVKLIGSRNIQRNVLAVVNRWCQQLLIQSIPGTIYTQQNERMLQVSRS